MSPEKPAQRRGEKKRGNRRDDLGPTLAKVGELLGGYLKSGGSWAKVLVLVGTIVAALWAGFGFDERLDGQDSALASTSAKVKVLEAEVNLMTSTLLALNDGLDDATDKLSRVRVLIEDLQAIREELIASENDPGEERSR